MMTMPPPPADKSEQIIPLRAEELSVAVVRRKTARVRLHVRTEEHQHEVDEPLTSHRLDVQRVRIDRPVDAAPPTRVEGDTTIMSVVKELLVLERRLVVTEEVRLRHVAETRRHRETVTLRTQHATIDRIDEDDQV